MTDEKALAPVAPGFINPYLSNENFRLAQRVALMYAKSDMVPKEYRGNPSNCMIALEMAHRMKLPPAVVFQDMYVVHGKPGWSAKALLGFLKTSGKIKGHVQYDLDMKAGTCRAWAETPDGRKLDQAPVVSLKMAQDEKWGPKWKTMPEVMLKKRAVAFFQREYFPELTMGLYTADELADIPPEVNITAEALVLERNQDAQPVDLDAPAEAAEEDEEDEDDKVDKAFDAGFEEAEEAELVDAEDAEDGPNQPELDDSWMT